MPNIPSSDPDLEREVTRGKSMQRATSRHKQGFWGGAGQGAVAGIPFAGPLLTDRPADDYGGILRQILQGGAKVAGIANPLAFLLGPLFGALFGGFGSMAKKGELAFDKEPTSMARKGLDLGLDVAGEFVPGMGKHVVTGAKAAMGAADFFSGDYMNQIRSAMRGPDAGQADRVAKLWDDDETLRGQPTRAPSRPGEPTVAGIPTSFNEPAPTQTTNFGATPAPAPAPAPSFVTSEASYWSNGGWLTPLGGGVLYGQYPTGTQFDTSQSLDWLTPPPTPVQAP